MPIVRMIQLKKQRNSFYYKCGMIYQIQIIKIFYMLTSS